MTIRMAEVKLIYLREILPPVSYMINNVITLQEITDSKRWISIGWHRSWHWISELFPHLRSLPPHHQNEIQSSMESNDITQDAL